jgi:AbrB family looped-hinge helix DNA binding protein
MRLDVAQTARLPAFVNSVLSMRKHRSPTRSAPQPHVSQHGRETIFMSSSGTAQRDRAAILTGSGWDGGIYGRLGSMKTTMDRAGRLVIPKEIRREARLAPGVPLEVRWREGRIEIEPAPVAVRLQRRGRLLVAMPRKKTPALTAEAVEQTRSNLLDDRSQGG